MIKIDFKIKVDKYKGLLEEYGYKIKIAAIEEEGIVLYISKNKNLLKTLILRLEEGMEENEDNYFKTIYSLRAKNYMLNPNKLGVISIQEYYDLDKGDECLYVILKRIFKNNFGDLHKNKLYIERQKKKEKFSIFSLF